MVPEVVILKYHLELYCFQDLGQLFGTAAKFCRIKHSLSLKVQFDTSTFSVKKPVRYITKFIQ